ncbi:ATP-binding protein [Aetokthonos hydrillicola Thurmond2011]|uniref:Circadian input-output histidine kinase CikA n=2 Tax=Aetokthonos TaxID=1550243 RepID=A0AAP5IAZ1_9CYAN|nr:ATP-binding protein [Aetokthonos hydrillicola]MBO3462395.1 PAS domain S-box protein [Aetokthonos hydrillicola CCALA 1050]MBW4590378.1 PAS domain S-box protein [Aetokthonos hydrillicola CCALA 1050]MDR9898181.1 ATP-binding protein [Aetokthonos hydrillicola Thurmond2011]
MNLDKFAQQIDQVRQRTETLDQHVSESSLARQDLLAQALDRLKVALEELHSAEEELLVQNEELANAQKLIEQERQRYQELFDFAPDGYLVTDCDGKILEANRAAVNLLKVSKKMLTGKLVINFILNEDRRAFRTQLLQLRKMGQIQEWEVRLQPRQDEQFCCSINVATVYDHEDNPLGLRWLLRDITARKQAEEQLGSIQLQNLQLQEATRIKSQFMSVMSHELRTPMNAILGFSQLLLRRYYHLFPPELRTMVEKIINSGKHLLALIEDILDFSALEAGKVDLQLQEFNLVDLVTTTTQQLHFLAEQKNLTLAVHTEIENPLIVNDSDRVRQILVNLLSNAIKFTDGGGILIELQELNQDRLTLTVRDTGIGIPEAELKNIFQGFWQLNQSTTRKYGGTGLGLAIVDKLLRLMNGTITVESKQDQGSTFRVVLPRQVKKSASE